MGSSRYPKLRYLSSGYTHEDIQAHIHTLQISTQWKRIREWIRQKLKEIFNFTTLHLACLGHCGISQYLAHLGQQFSFQHGGLSYLQSLVCHL